MELKMHPQHKQIKKYADAKASDTFKRRFGALGDGGPEGDTVKARAAASKNLRKLKKPLAKTKGLVKKANKIAKKSSDRMINLTRQDHGDEKTNPTKKFTNKQRRDQMKSGSFGDANDKYYRGSSRTNEETESLEEAVLRKNFDSQPNPTMMKKSTMDKAKGLNVKVVKPKNQKSKNDLMFQGKSSDLKKLGSKLTLPLPKKEETESLEERNKQNAMKRKMMDASRGARYKLNNPNVPNSDHKTPQAQNKAIGRALRSFEDANSDSMENQEKMNRKMKRKSDANARKERETDHGYKAAMKESLIDKVVEKLDEGAFKRMVTDKQEKERLAKTKKPQGNNRSYMTPKVDKYGRSNKMYFHPSEDAQSDARRDAKMDSRGLAQTKKDKPDMEHKGKKAGDEKDGGHIVMQLRKAVSIGKPVKFKDGRSHNPQNLAAFHKRISKK